MYYHCIGWCREMCPLHKGVCPLSECPLVSVHVHRLHENGKEFTLTVSSVQTLLTVELYSCDCAAGYTGRDCGINIDDCPGNSCVVGHTRACVDGLQSYTCECLPGYSGQFCEEDIDECEVYGCMNGGTCEDLVGGFTCTCPEFYSGEECEIPIDGDQCVPPPCLNGGTCIDDVRSHH